jgi:hypothetical protein
MNVGCSLSIDSTAVLRQNAGDPLQRLPMSIDYDPSRVALYSPQRRDSLFQNGHAYSPVQLAMEAARLAYVGAEKSAAELARLTEALARAGFGAPILFADAKTGTEAFASHRHSDGSTLLSFRGTQPDDVSDLATDLRANTVAWSESAGRVHAGFAAATRALMPQLRTWLDGSAPDPSKLILTGHSLGAALATLVATLWQPGLLVTLGSPRIGDANFAATLATIKIMRFVNCCDAVTELPPPIGGYLHVTPCIYITRDGEHVENPAEVFIAADRLRARTDYLARYAWRTGAVLVRDLADHAPINYARTVFP